MKKTIEVDGVTYDRREQPDGERMYLIVCDNRGLTFVGRADLSGESEQIIIHGARCVIRWGTSNHIGELVGGSRPNTRLGAEQDIIVFRRNLIAAYELSGDWS